MGECTTRSCAQANGFVPHLLILYRLAWCCTHWLIFVLKKPVYGSMRHFPVRLSSARQPYYLMHERGCVEPLQKVRDGRRFQQKAVVAVA
jgi:hypothetical protein